MMVGCCFYSWLLVVGVVVFVVVVGVVVVGVIVIDELFSLLLLLLMNFCLWISAGTHEKKTKATNGEQNKDKKRKHNQQTTEVKYRCYCHCIAIVTRITTTPRMKQ